MVRNDDNVPEWSNIIYPPTVVSVSQHSKSPTMRVGLVQSRYHIIKCNLSSQWYSWNIAQLTLNNIHSLTHSLTWVRMYPSRATCLHVDQNVVSVSYQSNEVHGRHLHLLIKSNLFSSWYSRQITHLPLKCYSFTEASYNTVHKVEQSWKKPRS